MALPHELPIVKPDITDPEYQRYVWARYLRQEVATAKAKRRKFVDLTLDGALEIAQALDPVARKLR